MTAVLTVDERADDDLDRERFADDVRDGLARPLKELPPKYLYDARGSALFDRICELPEYYPTRAERAILADGADAIAGATGAAELVELGSGSAAKTRLLLDALSAAGTLRRYVPFDIDGGVVRDSAHTLREEYPELTSVAGVVGDFERHLDRIPARGDDEGRIVALLGGTLGNFAPDARRRLLGGMAALLGSEDHVVVGVDLVKDRATVEAAYDDAAGVTAEFNRNLLHVLNREFDADFPVATFAHRAFFDPDEEWIEMRLRAEEACTVTLEALDLEVEFAAGEELRTELSCKFRQARLVADLDTAGLELSGWHTDAQDAYAVAVARAA